MKNTIQSPEALHVSSLLFDILSRQTSSVGIVVLDENGKICYSNTGITKHLGYNPEEIVGKNFTLLEAPDEVGDSNNADTRRGSTALESSTSYRYLVSKNGEYKWSLEETIYTLDNANSRYIKVIHDLQHQKQLEMELNHIKEAQHTFVHKASHDLKSPINNIEGLIAIIKEMWVNGENPAIILSMAQESVDKFKGILHEIRQATQAEFKPKP